MQNTDFLKNDLWRFYIGWLTYDWMNPDIRKDFDAEKWMEFFDAAQVRTITVHAKHHDGFYFYPSKYAPTPEQLPERDFIGEIMAAAKKHNIRVMLYFSEVYDYAMAKAHEDFRVVEKDNNGIQQVWLDYMMRNSYLCINNLDYQEILLAQIAELLNYVPNVIWLDNYSPKIKDNCMCRYCREKYHRETGLDLMDTAGNAWYEQCHVEFLQKVKAFIAERDSGCLLTTNPTIIPAIDAVKDYYVREGNTTMDILKYGRVWASEGKPLELLPGDHTQEFSWQMLTYDQLRLKAMACFSSGSAISLITHVTQGGIYQNDAMNVLTRLGSYLRKVEPYCLNTAMVSEALYIRPDATPAWANCWETVLLSNDILFTYATVHDEFSSQNHSVAILDPRVNVTPELMGKLEHYVSSGGHLLVEYNLGTATDIVGKRHDTPTTMEGAHENDAATGNSDAAPDVRNRMLILLGLKNVDKSPELYSYIQDWPEELSTGDIASDPLICDGGHMEVEIAGAQVLAYYVAPCAEHWSDKRIWNKLAPESHRSEKPAITVNCYGKGKAMFLAMPLVSREVLNYYINPQGEIRTRAVQFAANLTRSLLDEPYLAATTPTDVTVVVNKQSDSRYVIHVLNQYIETVKHPDQRSGIFRMDGIKLKFNTMRFGKIAKIEILNDNAETQELKFSIEGKWVTLQLPPLGVNALLLVSPKK